MAEPIVGVATPFGEGAVAVLRVSGDGSIRLVDSVFRGRRPLDAAPSRRMERGRIIAADGPVDEVLAAGFRAPASYTGEELVEIHGHGGILVARRLLESLLRAGARLAEPGEFTRRAFLNGKMDLTQAEAVMDLIRAKTDVALRAAGEQLEGRLGERVREIRDALLDALAHLEAHIDFPDEPIAPETGAALRGRIVEAKDAIARLIGTAAHGRVLREGARVVLAGPPNAGKSSLLNRLLGFDRAIVHETPGTTRDTIEEMIDLRGIPIRLSDTAGIREVADAVEREGVERSLRMIERADLVLRVWDGSSGRPIPSENPSLGRIPEIAVLNKSDLGEHPTWSGEEGVRMSCVTGEGEASLIAAIEAAIWGGRVSVSGVSVAINARHRACLEAAHRGCEAAGALLAAGELPELVAVELRAGLDGLGAIVGGVDVERLLDRIFATFCIGK